MNATSEATTYWVCVDCYYAHYGMLDDTDTTDRAPLALIPAGASVSSGLTAEEHAPDCPVWLGDPDRADVPVAGAACECERHTFSKAPCDGCGSRQAGAREALTVWQ